MIINELIPYLQKAVDDNCLYVQLPTYFVREILEKLKERETVAPLTIDDAVSEIMDKHYENLKQTAQSMMEGIVVSVPRENPCSSCQEFNCDFCGYKEFKTHLGVIP